MSGTPRSWPALQRMEARGDKSEQVLQGLADHCRVMNCLFFFLRQETIYLIYFLKAQWYFFEKYLFVCLCQVLVVALRLLALVGGFRVLGLTGMCNLSSPGRDQTRGPFIGRRISNHWTTREVSEAICFTPSGL